MFRLFGKTRETDKRRKSALVQGGIVTFERLGVNYWGITKCASTSIKRHLLELETGRRKQLRRPTAIHAKIADRYVSREDADRNGRTNFTVTRHPVARAVSAWRDLCHTRPERGEAAGIDPDWSFPRLTEYLADRSDADLDVHFRSQTWFITRPLEHEIDQKEIAGAWPFAFPAPLGEPEHSSVKADPQLSDAVLRRLMSRYESDFTRFGYALDG